MTPEWFAILGLFGLLLGQDARNDYEHHDRHLARWALFSVLGFGLFVWGVIRAVWR